MKIPRLRPKSKTGLAGNQTGLNSNDAGRVNCYRQYTKLLVNFQDAIFALTLGAIPCSP